MTPQSQQTLQQVVSVANGYNTKVWVTEPLGDMSSLISKGLNAVEVGNINTDSLAILALETCHQCSLLTGKVEVNNDIAVLDLGDMNASNERAWASRILYRPWTIYAGNGRPKDENYLTTLRLNDTGIWPLIVAGIVVSAIQAAAVVYCVEEASTLIDRKLSRDSDERKLAQTQATALKAVEVHTEREKAAGKTLPLSDALKGLLDSLGRMADRLASPSPQTELPNVVTGWLGGGSSGSSSVPWSLIALAALGVAALYLLSKQNNNKSYRLVTE